MRNDKYRTIVGKSERKWEDNIKMELEEMG
jgi:hypothetical protein